MGTIFTNENTEALRLTKSPVVIEETLSGLRYGQAGLEGNSPLKEDALCLQRKVFVVVLLLQELKMQSLAMNGMKLGSYCCCCHFVLHD